MFVHRIIYYKNNQIRSGQTQLYMYINVQKIVCRLESSQSLNSIVAINLNLKREISVSMR